MVQFFEFGVGLGVAGDLFMFILGSGIGLVISVIKRALD